MTTPTTTHTPGPWEIMPDTEFDHKMGWCVRQVGKHNPEIALIYGASRHNAKEGQAEARATTRLIAAAPDMLDALRGMIDWQDNKTGDYADMIENARAAIAKAEDKS